jgi:hypothetical protein
VQDLSSDPDAPRLPDWLLEEVNAWPADAWGVHHARLLLRDGRVVAPVAILPSGDIAGWGEAGEASLDLDDIVAVERADE